MNCAAAKLSVSSIACNRRTSRAAWNCSSLFFPSLTPLPIRVSRNRCVPSVIYRPIILLTLFLFRRRNAQRSGDGSCWRLQTRRAMLRGKRSCRRRRYDVMMSGSSRREYFIAQWSVRCTQMEEYAKLSPEEKAKRDEKEARKAQKKKMKYKGALLSSSLTVRSPLCYAIFNCSTIIVITHTPLLMITVQMA